MEEGNSVQTLNFPNTIYNQNNSIGDFDIKTFNIYYWQVRKTDGSGVLMSVEEVINRHNALNETYNDLGICFKIAGIRYIDDSTYYYFASNPENFPNITPPPLYSTYRNYLRNNYLENNAINVYFSRTLDFGGVTSYFSDTLISNQNVGTFVHEVGHILNLRHTFGNSNTNPSPTNCENITRDENDPDFNADIAGDLVADTNAVPNFHRQEHNHMARAIEAANIGYSFYSAINIAFETNGFSSYSDASAIEQALLNYGFTQTEVDYLKNNKARDYAYMNNCIYSPDSRVNDLTLLCLKIVKEKLML